jgi:signal transduction histidine kinase/BarA-like signal transduction histidine kinase
VDVLLVDDRPENLIALEGTLQCLGQNLVKVQSGRAALKYLLDHDVAVILLDVQMPDIDGFETARLIRQRQRSQHTPIIFLTAFSEQDELRFQGYTLGAVDYLYKPIDPTILASKVSVFIDLFRKNLEIKYQTAQLIAKNTEIICAQSARQQAEEANRLKDEFLAIISHELRTPLNSILGWAHLLLTRQFDPETTQRALETIERNARAQTQLVEDILDISKLMRGKVELSIHRINVSSFVDAMIESVRPQADAKSIHLAIQLDPSVPELEADPIRLRQIVSNLLTNAIKFTPEKGQIWVEVVPAARGFVNLQIRDTGEGIAPEFLPYIFDYFQQADSSSTRPHGGLGLGLAIVQQLVELHKGKIYAHSKGRDQGSTFSVHLPISHKEPGGDANTFPEMKMIAVDQTLPSLDHLRVLVVEDHTDSREFIQEVLENAGAKVTAVDSVQAAIAALEQTQFDIIVSDIAMPREDGYALIRQVRASQPEIPAIALTAMAKPDHCDLAIDAGFQMYLIKPVNQQELIRAIAQLTQPNLPEDSHQGYSQVAYSPTNSNESQSPIDSSSELVEEA